MVGNYNNIGEEILTIFEIYFKNCIIISSDNYGWADIAMAVRTLARGRRGGIARAPRMRTL